MSIHPSRKPLNPLQGHHARRLALRYVVPLVIVALSSVFVTHHFRPDLFPIALASLVPIAVGAVIVMWLLFRSDYFIVVNRFAYRRIGQTAGAAIVISDQGTHALLVKQTEDPYPNWWLPPAGYCKHEDGKAPEDSSTTAKRRFAELTGKGDVSTVRIAQTKGRSYAELCIRYGHLPIPVTVHRLTSSSTLSPATIQEDSMHRWVCLSDLRDDRFRVPEYYNEIMIAIMEGKGLTALRYWDVDPDYR